MMRQKIDKSKSNLKIKQRTKQKTKKNEESKVRRSVEKELLARK